MARTRAKLAAGKVDLRLLPGTTEGDILNALRARYGPPEWAFLPHMRAGTGWNANRTADAIAMSLWPSRGLELHGFEVKVSRSDWLREYRDPAKADELAAHCDRWHLVVAHESLAGHAIVQPGELPSPWGLIVFDGNGLAYVKDAEKLPITKEPGRSFMAAVMRRTQESLGQEAAIEMAVAEAEQRIRAEAEADIPHRIASVQEDLTRVREQVKAFEDASGIQIGEWTSGAKIGEAVRVVMSASGVVRQLRRLHASLGAALTEAAAIQDEVDA